LTITSFAQQDLSPDAKFTVVGTGDTTAITLTPKDGSDPVKLKVEGTGPYTVSAAEGFTPGASYELTLPKGLNFIGTNGEQLPETVRTASFTVDKQIVANLQMSEHVHYIQHQNPSSLTAGTKMTFRQGIEEGDLVCFYKKTNPKDRDYTSGNAYLEEAPASSFCWCG